MVVSDYKNASFYNRPQNPAYGIFHDARRVSMYFFKLSYVYFAFITSSTLNVIAVIIIGRTYQCRFNRQVSEKLPS